MAIQDKIIAGITLIHSSLGVIWTFLVASQVGFPLGFIATNLVLTATGFIAGIGLLMQRCWAVYLAIAFFLVQLIHVITPTFQWSFTLGLNFNIALGWLSTGELGLNVFALVMLLWLGTRAFAPNNSFKPNPHQGGA